MTGAQTDVVTVGAFDVVAGALTRVALRLFKEWANWPHDLDPEPRPRLFECWQVIRETAMKLTARRALELAKFEVDALFEALRECAPDPDIDFIFTTKFTERG